jgi:molecular chaperone GrpE
MQDEILENASNLETNETENKGENEIQLLKQEIEELKKQFSDEKSKILLAFADSENTVKRLRQNLLDSESNAIRKFVKRFIDSIEDFAFAIKQETAHSKNPENNHALHTMQSVYKKLSNLLNEFAVTEIEVEIGEKFNPSLHEAITAVNHDLIAEGNIVEKLRPGFKLKDSILKPATVVVSKGKLES